VRIGREFRVRVGAAQQLADVVPGRAELVPRGERVTDQVLDDVYVEQMSEHGRELVKADTSASLLVSGCAPDERRGSTR